MKIIKTKWGEIQYYLDINNNYVRRIYRDGKSTVEILIKCKDGGCESNSMGEEKWKR